MSETPKKYNIDNAKNDIQNLQVQNSYDFQEIKRLDRLINKYDNRVTQAINLNNQINKKIEDDYENIKKIIIDENVSVTLDKKIDDKYNSNKSKIEEIEANVSEQLDKKANKSYVDTKIGNMGNIKTFKGSCLYSDLPVSSNVDDYWYITDKDTNYCWNGSKWIDIGNNLNIGNNTITRSKTDYYTLLPDGNLYERDKLTKGKYIQASDGKWVTSSDYNETDFIEIDVNKTYYHNFSSHITFYDSEKVRIKGYATATIQPDTKNPIIGVPSNTKYIRMSIGNARLGQAVIAHNAVFDFNLKNLYNDTSLMINNKNLQNIKYDGNKIENKSITREKLEFLNLSEYNNLLLKENVNYWGYLYTNNGSKVNGDYGTIIFTVDELDIVNETYSFNFDSHITYWTSDKTFISGYIQSSLGGKNKENLKNIPDNVYYIYMSVYKSAIDYAVFANAKYFKHGLKPMYKDDSLIVFKNNFNENIFSNIYGKSFLFFGDSWCAGNTSAPGGWANWLKNKYPSITVKNCGVHGYDWAQCYSNWIANIEKWESLSDDYDYIIIESFTNGLYGTVTSLNKQLGTIDEFTYYNSVDEIENALGNTFAKDMEKCIYKITERWAGKKIGLMFPYKSVNMLRENNAFRVFREQVFKCCRKYNIPVLDNFDSCNIQSYRAEFVEKYYFEQDGTHLNSLGYDIICPPIESWLNTL